MIRKMFKKIVSILICTTILSCFLPLTSFAATIDRCQLNPGSLISDGNNITYYGPLSIETHLLARIGYDQAFYAIYIYAPSDVVGIRINDLNIITGNSVYISGTVNETINQTEPYEPLTVKVSLFYNDKAPYISNVTISTDHWCRTSDHEVSNHCVSY